MEVFFKKRRLQEIFSNRRKLVAEYGTDNAKKIMLRMNEFVSVENLSQISELPPPRRHELQGERKEQFAVDIKQPYRIIFSAYHEVVPRKDDGSIDCEKVTRILILEVEDYHGK